MWTRRGYHRGVRRIFSNESSEENTWFIKIKNNKEFKMEEFIFEILRKLPEPYLEIVRVLLSISFIGFGAGYGRYIYNHL